jgi:hypothetical protein
MRQEELEFNCSITLTFSVTRNIGEFGHIFTEKEGVQKPGCEASGEGSKLKKNNNNREVGSSSSWFDIIAAKNASFAVHWEVMCGCAGASVDADKDG